MKPSELLLDCASKAKFETMCAGTAAMDANGLNIAVCDKSAVRWCAIGLLRRERNGSISGAAMSFLYEVIDSGHLATWSDNLVYRGQFEEIEKAFKDAAELAIAAGQ